MKKINTIYWICTGLFAAFMLFTAIPNIIMDPGSIELISTQLHYPTYIIPFLGVAKTLGAIGIIVPGFPRLKEWAYAGLFFDIAGAIYSSIAVGGFDPMILTLLVPIGFGVVSYIYHHKRLNAQ